jgi:CheY-like chemotaxis protein
VAVVDDDRSVRDLLEAILSEEGYVVTSIHPNPNLLTELRSARPALIVLDWRVGASGGSAFEAIRADADLAGIPLLICTGDLVGMRAEARRLATQPHVAIVEKPFQVDSLLAVAERLVGVSRTGSPAATRDLPPALRDATRRRGAPAQARAVLTVFRGIGGWSCAELWVNDRGLLRCVGAVSTERHRGFARHSRRTRLVPGFGLPGRVGPPGSRTSRPIATSRAPRPRVATACGRGPGSPRGLAGRS